MPVDVIRDRTSLARRHVVFGWWALLVFLTLGITLEILHGLKIGFYLDTSNEVRRLMWTLAHAHGTLFALVHIVFGLTLGASRDAGGAGGQDRLRGVRLASPCLSGASILLPGGFFLGGFFVYGGDPGLGIFLVPVGAALLLAAVFMAASKITKDLDFDGAAGAPGASDSDEPAGRA